MNSSNAESGVSDAEVLLKRLEHLTNQLRNLGKFCGLTTLASFLPLIFASLLAGVGGGPPDLAGQVVLFGVALAIAAIFFLYLFDQKRKIGDIVFQELSDELEWSPYQRGSTNKFATSKPPGSADVPRAAVRLSVREYLLASTLPLVERENSVRVYFMLNVVCMVAIILLIAVAKHRA